MIGPAEVVRRLGVLRTLLAAFVLTLVAIAPVAGGPADLSGGWTAITTVVAPAFYVVVLFVIPLDITMSRVFLGSAESEAERARFRFIVRAEIVLLVLLLVSWAPFVAKVLRLA